MSGWQSRGREGDPQDFLNDFAAWHEDLTLLIRNARTCFRWGCLTVSRCPVGLMVP